MYVLSEIGTHKKIKRFVLCSSLFTVVYIYIYVICGKLLHTLAKTTRYLSGLFQQ